MTDTTLPPGDEAGDRIEPVDIQQEMQRSYIDYAMSVIVGRALPLVEDGLKPVHRRGVFFLGGEGVPPPRRLRDLRRPRAVGPAVGVALPADRRAGQLRLTGQRPGRRHEVHGVPA